MTAPSFDDSMLLRRCVRASQRVFDLPAAGATFPLLRRILNDLVALHATHASQTRATEKLRAGGDADWSDRKALFRLNDARRAIEGSIEAALQEIRALGAVVLDPTRGVVGFPTIVNGSLAYLVFRQEDDDAHYWRYRDQNKLRPIPQSWRACALAGAECGEGLLV